MRRTGLTLPRLAALAAGFLLLGGTVAAQAAPKIQVHFIAGHGETWTDPDPSDANNVSTLGPFAANAALPLTDTAYKHHYLISIQADGYEVAGGFFDYDPTSTAATVDVYVPLSANPIPLATYRTDVFFDMSGTNAEYDRDPETPPADGSGSIVPGVTT